ncbi:MAG TPA: TonB-dependent receptor [Sphingopyxis sp.]|nr:TonB-dependent receptor [Sphingopyxis sp.]HMP44291.1 TonB-dependent receptor [Sphingopyxis sp.]HMQ17922.1 TonB-dependent receptor [Sphingopyxis sp.]
MAIRAMQGVRNLSRLACGASLAVLAVSPAWAQDVAPAADDDEIVVTGFRASLDAALDAKRRDGGIVDVIKAEDIGKFPDTNLAESLQRVPGVVIDRDAGEGRSITVRGLGQDFTRIRINGVEALATTGGTDSSGGANRSRGFDFNVFASELFNSITVRKSASANVDEGSLGATVDLQAARPFDFDGFRIAGSIKARYNDLNEKIDPRAALLISNTFADGRFGVLVSAAYSKRRLYEEGFSTVRWDNGPSSQGWCAPIGLTSQGTNATQATCGPAAQGVARLPDTPANRAAFAAASDPANFHPRLPRYGRLTHDQDRLGITASVQWAPTDNTTITAEFLYSKLKATRQEDFIQAISFSRNAAAGGKPQTSVVETQYDSNGALLYGVYNGVDIRSESRFDKLSTEFTQPTLTIDHAFSDRLRFNARVGRADSKFRNPMQTTTTLDALNVNGYSIDFRNSDRLPAINFGLDVNSGAALQIIGVPQAAPGATQPNTIPNTTSSEIRIRPQGASNRNDVLHFDLTWDIVPDAFSVNVGADFKKYTFDTFEFRRVNQNDTIFAPTGGMSGLTTTVTGFGKGLGSGAVTGWIIPDLKAISAAYDIYCNCLKSGPAGGPGDFTLSSITNGNARGNNRRIVERDTSGFLMFDFKQDVAGIPVRGNFGVRYVETDITAQGYVATGGGTLVTVKNKYEDWLPSLNLAANVTDDFIVRFAAARVMARPQLGNLNPGGTINTTGNLTIAGGNPLLKPFRANTLDASFEWYHGKGAFVGLGLFYKDIGTYIQQLRTTIPYNQTGLPLSLLPSNFTGDELFQVTTPINTSGGALKGFEVNVSQPFDFLPGALRHFGVTANYTRVQSKINYQISPTATGTIRDNLINLSPESWNATLYYDDKKFSARASVAYRSDYLQRVPGQNNNDVEGKNSTLNVDAQLRYKINNWLEVTLEGVNLTDEFNDQFISRARNSVVVYNHTGREFLAGVRFKF